MLKRTTLPRPPPLPRSSSPTIPRRPFLPLLPHPVSPSASTSQTLPYPYPQLEKSSIPGYTLSNYLLPAAFPRSTSFPAGMPSAADSFRPIEKDESKEERMKRVERESSELVGLMHQGIERGGEREAERGGGLRCLLTRFVKEGVNERLPKKEGVTLVLGHANGLPPRNWDLPLKSAIESLQNSSVEIEEAWLFSSPLTHSHLHSQPTSAPSAPPPSFTWTDHARDLTSFLTHHLPLLPSPSSLPPVLSSLPLPPSLSSPNSARDLPRRKLVGVGHSWSGASFLLAELEAANHRSRSSSSPGEMDGKEPGGRKGIWDGLILVEPMVLNPKNEHIKGFYSSPEKPSRLTRGAMGRKDVWASRAEAKASFLNSPFFQSFHPKQLESYINHALVPLHPSPPATPTSSSSPSHSDEGPVTLACPRWGEALVFAESSSHGEVWDRLQTRGEKIGEACREVRWVVGGEGGVMGPSGDVAHLVHLLDGETGSSASYSCAKNTHLVLQGSGHLVVQQHPEEMGRIIAEFLTENFGEKGSRMD